MKRTRNEGMASPSLWFRNSFCASLVCNLIWFQCLSLPLPVYRIAAVRWASHQLESLLLCLCFLRALTTGQRAYPVIFGLANQPGDRDRIDVLRFVLLPVFTLAAEAAVVGQSLISQLSSLSLELECLGPDVFYAMFLEKLLHLVGGLGSQLVPDESKEV